jgi:2-polyprenyl-3-methyl-5-hydroxy-6-metoxy-1,4-benzoquinol methylase
VFSPVQADPAPELVRRITFVPFLPDGRCVLVETADGPRLPHGEVLAGEDYLTDTVLRVPLHSAGFRYQRFRPFGLDGDHLYAWIEGDRYAGERAHATPELGIDTAERAAARLRAHGQPAAATAVTAAADSYRGQTDECYYADSLRTLERAYLRGQTVQEGSGFGGDERQWRLARHHITDAIATDGTFLDVGCANGLLMESVAAWCAERGLTVQPYGVDLGAGLVDEARRRLPRWADRIWVGNAIDWLPPARQRFDYVHVLLDCVPAGRRAELIRHHLAGTVTPGTGRLLVSDYGGSPPAADALRALGFAVAGQTSPVRRPGRPLAPTSWIDAQPAVRR